LVGLTSISLSDIISERSEEIISKGRDRMDSAELDRLASELTGIPVIEDFGTVFGDDAPEEQKEDGMMENSQRLEALTEVAEILGISVEEAEQVAPLLKQQFGDEVTDAPKEQEEEVVMIDEQVPTAEPSSKIKCKCCGFFKKPRKVLRDTGICGVCTAALSESKDGAVEVIGRMGKRGRNSVSVVIDGKRWKVKRLSSKHSERVAAMYASKPKGYARKAKRTGSGPKGLPTDSRIGADREQRTYEN
jgi:hypothetical protein